MALDRQKILTELGSVMNQLKSVDCGCMGKIFGNSKENAASTEHHFQSCGGHSYCHEHAPSYGYSQNASHGKRCSASLNMYPPCVGHCNPPKVFTDTYSYLNQNLVQPTIKEVYEDLKSITPANTVTNNPIASQMGLKTGFAGQINHADNSAIPFNNINQMGQPGGMGPQIMNMLGENIMNSNNTENQTGQIAKSIDGPHLPHGTGVTPLCTQLRNPYVGETNVTNQSTNQLNTVNANLQNTMSGNRQISPITTNYNLYGQHSHGIAKFNEMFPGVAKNDLGFDPMAIAIQMNPANQNKTAMNSCHKMINNNNDINRNICNNNNATNLETPNSQNNEIISQILPTVYEENIANAQSMAPKQLEKEPIFPAYTSKYAISNQKYKGYNTLGQPIEMLPADIYHTPVPSLPQTLSPQIEMKYLNDNAKYSNVKSTISKTSLLASNPIGKIPSKNQLQQIYNQYKGSHSYTQQNVKDQVMKRVSNSDPRLRTPPVHSINYQQVPIERIGGDTAANNLNQDQRSNKIEQVIGEIGDVPSANKPFREELTQKMAPHDNRKCRNGLQDVIFTSYPTSAAWSFHGYNKPLPSVGYRYRNKILK